MKKFGVLFLLIVLGGMFSSPAFAEPVQMEIEIIREPEVLSPLETAIVEGERVLIPVDVVHEYLYKETRIDQKTRQMNVRFSMPKASFQDAALDRFFFSGWQISLPLEELNGRDYINLAGLEKLFGADLKVDFVEKKLRLFLNRYSFFSPAKLALPVGGRRDVSKPVSLVWQPTFEPQNNLAAVDSIAGLNVVSPSWFSIIDEWGTVKNTADLSYVKAAQGKGYEVWALITNSFDPDLTSKILHNPSARKNVIKQLIIYASLYQLNGINLDFENIYDTDREALSDFVREITEALHEVNVVVSMDVTAPSAVSQWSLSYDRKAIGETVDYVMLMAYDEHWRTSPVSGSVASIGWVENGVKNTLKEVPAEKLVLGVPFYMRKWEEIKSGGKIKVKASTLTMEAAQELAKDKRAKIKWLEEQGQHYFEYEENGAKYKVWMEDEKSLHLKLDLIQKYGLAGVAGWRKGFETPEIWDLIEKKLDLNQPCV